MGQELQVPTSFQNKAMAGAFAAQLNATDDNLSEGIGQSYAVIGYKGKVWSLRHRGERKTVLRPDDGTPSAYLDVIVLGQAKTKSKSFYKKYDPNTSDGDRPLCSSIDGVVPDVDVVAKQCDSCALCPRNVWKTDPGTGRKGRECTDYKRLAVLILPTQSKPTLGSPLMEPVFLRVPPDSLNSLAIMGETMANQGHHYSSYITRITFDPNKAHPCMVFRPLQPLTDAEAPVILDLCKDATVGRITGGDVATAGMKAVAEALPPPAATGLTATASASMTQPKPEAQPAPQQQVQPDKPAATSTGLDTTSAAASSVSSLSTIAAQPATPTPSTSTEPSGISTGLINGTSGGANTASAGPSPSGLTQTAGDAGKAEESDEELDAQIAALIAPK